MSALAPVSVYVHFPYCLKKCPYCDFNSFAVDRPQIDHIGYADAVLRELDARVSQGQLSLRPLKSIFFGGGTPSLWRADQIGRVIQAIRATFPDSTGIEVSAECNPTSLDETQVVAFLQAGINRFSIGVQSLDNNRLQYLGRLHDRDLALTSLKTARKYTDRVSADFMFGLPNLTPQIFCDELTQVLDLGVSHISAYALTIESGTQFGALAKKGKLPIASDDSFADTYLATEAFMRARGFAHYEVSNYAQPQRESQHNAHYWAAGDYLGVGAGAVGSFADGHGIRTRTRSHSRVENYLAARGASEAFTEWQESLGSKERLNEKLMLGLRTTAGAKLEGPERETFERSLSTKARTWFQDGSVQWQDERLHVHPRAWLRLDAIVGELFV